VTSFIKFHFCTVHCCRIRVISITYSQRVFVAFGIQHSMSMHHTIKLPSRLYRIPVGGSEIFHTCPERPWGPRSLLYNGYRVSSGGKEWPGRDADPSTPSSAVAKKEWSYTSTSPIGRTDCTEPQCLYSTAIPLLPLWAVRPVQSLSACTV